MVLHISLNLFAYIITNVSKGQSEIQSEVSQYIVDIRTKYFPHFISLPGLANFIWLPSLIL